MKKVINHLKSIFKFNIFLGIWFLFCFFLFFYQKYQFPSHIKRNFLLLNLLLATIPYLISQLIFYFEKVRDLLKYPLLIMSFITWIIFLPNSPYTFTDLVHLQTTIFFRFNVLEGFSFKFWLDFIIFSNFGLLSFYLGLLSLHYWVIFLKSYYKKLTYILMFFAFSSVGIGVYLGRFIRVFSWEAFMNYKFIFYEIHTLLNYPYAIIFSFMISLTYFISYLVFFSLKKNDF